MDAQQWPAAVLQAEEALEADGEIEVAAGVEPALAEGLDPREPAAAQRHPRHGVGADDDIGTTGRGALAGAGAVRRAADLPGVADVSEDDPPRRVEAGLGAEVAVGQRSKAGLDGR